MSICFVSDIHSQYENLKRAVDYAISQNLTIIFLGDIFDTHVDSSDSVGVYHLVKSLVDVGHFCLNSNHQDKLIRYLKGNKITQNHGIDVTIREFEEADVNKTELYEFLTSLPYGIVCKNSYGKEYRAAHAYFPHSLEIPSYNDFYFVTRENLNRKLKDLMLYGKLNRDNTRTSWWENNNLPQNYIRVAGHYHRVVVNSTSVVLDSSCGSGGPLSLYNVDTGTVKEF